jgi:hypothetical protein
MEVSTIKLLCYQSTIMIVHVNNIESDNHDLIIGYSNTTFP